MPVIYQWKGKNPRGRTVKGEMEAETVEQVRQNLVRRKIVPGRIKKNPRTFLKMFPSCSPVLKKVM